MKIVKGSGYIGTDERRLYLNGLFLDWECECGTANSIQLHQDTYFYDCIESGKVKDFTVCCKECEKEVTFKAKLNIDFEIVEED